MPSRNIFGGKNAATRYTLNITYPALLEDLMPFLKHSVALAVLLSLGLPVAAQSTNYHYQVFSPGVRGQVALPSEPPAVATSYLVLTTGNSYVIPTGVATLEVWAIGGGGGGAGTRSISTDSGGGGGAGGVAYASFAVAPGGALTYTLAAGGVPGFDGTHGASGGTTSVSYSGLLLTANGGQGGRFGNTSGSGSAYGGSATGGSVNVTGGNGGSAPYGNNGAGGGGAIGRVSAAGVTGSTGTNGASASFPAGLDAALTSAGVPLGAPGLGTRSNSPGTHGGSATGVGHGGGGAGDGGGNGGDGAIGGGGGGAHSRNTMAQTGGRGGAGLIVLKLN